jgi:thiamine-phosphate pyrophosphorylase
MLVLTPARSRLPPADLADAAVRGGADAIQVRLSGAEGFRVGPSGTAAVQAPLSGAAAANLRAVASAVAARIGDRAAVLVNGDAALAADLGLGLHLPARFGPDALAAARKLLPPASFVGRSVHSAAEAAATVSADYLLAGHVFPTASHPGQPPLGPAGLARIVAAAPYPVLAIGGIDAGNAGSAIAAGAAGVAVVGAIAAAPNPETAARDLRAAIDRAVEARRAMATTERQPGPNPDPAADGATALALTVNGKPMPVPAGWTVHDFLASKGLADRMAIVERNGEIVPRAAYGDTKLADGDRLEVVHAVGGG